MYTAIRIDQFKIQLLPSLIGNEILETNSFEINELEGI